MASSGFGTSIFRTPVFVVALLCASVPWMSGCAADHQLADLQRQVQLQGEQIRRQGAQIQALKESMSRPTATAGALPACDRNVMRRAVAQGDSQRAQGHLLVASGYYQDALTACPGNPQAELKMAQLDEQLGNRADAIDYYRRVLSGNDATAADAARQALSRLGNR